MGWEAGKGGLPPRAQNFENTPLACPPSFVYPPKNWAPLFPSGTRTVLLLIIYHILVSGR